ncbi:DnaJ domain-containing protein [Devosia sp.]|uniref:DnaJ domain-containing protein n=1 Tax=Devosia sp. TaxID=1871048 RepID=UPI002AFF37F2|nr:DnaJ domain-containing protein [Devosia sp.]
MSWIFLGGVALLAILAVVQSLRRLPKAQQMRLLRWLLGGIAALVAVALLVARRIDIAIFAAAAAFSILRRGRLGPFSLDAPTPHEGNSSKVRSRFFSMELDHDSGKVEGWVLSGQFTGRDLMDLDAEETRALIAEVDWDPDSLSLLESWLDANRAGWREYFAEEDAGQAEPADPVAEAYAVLGLSPGASDEEIRAAHRELMKAVHPDHGGSSYLASKINEARDRLLRH